MVLIYLLLIFAGIHDCSWDDDTVGKYNSLCVQLCNVHTSVKTKLQRKGGEKVKGTWDLNIQGQVEDF